MGRLQADNPRNRRRRAAALVRQVSRGGRTTVLIDTPPDLRDQMIDARAGRVDAVLYTHDHADHVHGIDDLRVLALNAKRRVPVYMDGPTMASLDARFGYCFQPAEG
ncbi:MAG: MBL fold metallo-hydrolase [Hyphomicrobiaceae bacterium]